MTYKPRQHNKDQDKARTMLVAGCSNAHQVARSAVSGAARLARSHMGWQVIAALLICLESTGYQHVRHHYDLACLHGPDASVNCGYFMKEQS